MANPSVTCTSFPIDKKLFLVWQIYASESASGPRAVPAPIPVDHIAVIDCSGSMAYDLPKIREQLKARLPKLLREGDTLSILWFSSRGEHGVLMEGEPVATLKDLKSVNERIDRWLKPIAMTGFKEPLIEAAEVARRVAEKHGRPSHAALFFMSDGHDNQWPHEDILRALDAKTFVSATFVEYGFYADRALLAKMAERAGGSLMFAKDFDEYAPTFESAVKKPISGKPRVKTEIEGDPIMGFCWSMSDGDLITYGLTEGTISRSEDVDEIWYLSSSVVGRKSEFLIAGNALDTSGPVAAYYAAVSLFSTRMKPDIVLPFLRVLGDVALIDQFSGCFGKQRYTDFQERARVAAFTPEERWTKGFDRNLVPKDDAFTVHDLLTILADDPGNLVLLDHPGFSYSRIGRARVAGENDGVKFERKEQAPGYDGYPIRSLVLNESRPNINFRVRIDGTVPMPLPPGKVPERFDTFIWRTFTVVKDGLINIDRLPLRVTHSTWEKLKKVGFVPTGAFQERETGVDLIASLEPLPVVNRKMVQELSAKDFFETHYQLVRAQARQRVFNGLVKEMAPRDDTKSFAVVYGENEAKWLKEHGITEGGFHPKTEAAPLTGDMYMSKELKVSLKGLSSLPSFKEGRTAWLAKKTTKSLGARLMFPAFDEANEFLTSKTYTKAAKKAQPALLEAWLQGQANDATESCRTLLRRVAEMTFVVIVGQTWFKEFASLEENSMTIEVDGDGPIDCRVEMREVEVKL